MRRSVKVSFRSVILTATLGPFLACVAPVPAPTRTSAPPELKNKIDTHFIEPGQTTREQVDEKLGWSRVDIGEDKIFWGRWSTSSSAILWGIGAYGDGAAGANRHWSVKNILIEFDDNGAVRSSRLLGDGDIAQQLRPLLTPQRNRFEPAVALYIDHVRRTSKNIVTLELGRNVIRYTEPEAKKGAGLKFEVPPEALTGVTIPNFQKAKAENPDDLWFTLHFSQKTPAGRDITLAGSPEDLATVIRFHKQIVSTANK